MIRETDAPRQQVNLSVLLGLSSAAIENYDESRRRDVGTKSLFVRDKRLTLERIKVARKRCES